jgi:integrase
MSISTCNYSHFVYNVNMQITNQLIEKTITKCDEHMRSAGLSKQTRDSYRSNIRRFLNWQKDNWLTIKDLDHEKRMEGFISALANDKKRPIAFTTQNQYFNSILYFYREFQGKPINKINAARAPRTQRVFSLLSPDQLRMLFDALPTLPLNIQLLARLMYGTGMRLDEVLSLRTKDILFNERLIAVQEGKGDKARLVDMPTSLVGDLQSQLLYARACYDTDRALKRAGVHLPNGLSQKYPAYATTFEWYWAFPHTQEGRDPDSGIKRRYHIYDFDVQKVFRETRRALKLPEHTTAHTLRHCYATHYLKHMLAEVKKTGVEIPDLYGFCRNALRKKLGHVSDKTTDIYIHLASERNSVSDASPIDLL